MKTKRIYSTEEAVQEVLKDAKRLQDLGIDIEQINKDLKDMEEHCHKEIFENGKLQEHMPMTLTREETTRNTYHICKQCISKYLMENPKAFDTVVILRGEPTQECREFLTKYIQEERKRGEKYEDKEAKEITRRRT